MLYLAIYVGLVLLKFATLNMRRSHELLYLPLLYMLFAFSALRFDVGCDWSNYIVQFQRYKNLELTDILQQREPMFVSLFVFQHWLGLPYPWINVFSSAIFFLGTHVLARRQPDPFAFLILLYPILIINMPMSGIRQGAAIGIMCVAFAAFLDQRMIRFVAITCIAAAFHASALIFLLLAPLVHGKYSAKQLILAALLAIPGGFLLLSSDAAEIASQRYIGTGLDSNGAIFRVGVLTLSAIFYLLILRRKWLVQFVRDYKLVTVGSFIMISIMPLLFISNVIGDRLGYYLIPIQAIIFARVPYLNIHKHRQLYIVAPYLLILLIFGVWIFISNLFHWCYLPYQTWLFGFPTSKYIY